MPHMFSNKHRHSVMGEIIHVLLRFKCLKDRLRSVNIATKNKSMFYVHSN